MQLWAIIGGGSVVVGVTAGLGWIDETRQETLKQRIRAIYEGLGYSEPTLQASKGSG